RRRLHHFPTRRSSDLIALAGVRPEIETAGIAAAARGEQAGLDQVLPVVSAHQLHQLAALFGEVAERNVPRGPRFDGINIELLVGDRKSTRLNSSHLVI